MTWTGDWAQVSPRPRPLQALHSGQRMGSRGAWRGGGWGREVRAVTCVGMERREGEHSRPQSGSKSHSIPPGLSPGIQSGHKGVG